MSDVMLIDDEIKTLIADVIEENSETLDNDARFVEDLGVDSLKALEILAVLEKKYKIEIPESRLTDITTVNNAIQVTREIMAAKK